jgi:STE24 endopeptidase
VAALWALAASRLWATSVPDGLRLPALDERSLFGAALVHDAQRFERFLDWTWVAATLASIAGYVAVVRRARTLAPRLGLGGVNAGIVLGVVALTVAWAASLPFVVAVAWWERRHGVSRQSYAATLASTWGGALGVAFVATILLAIVLALARRLGRRWWIAAAPALAAIFFALQLATPYLASVGTHPLRSAALRADVERLERREHAGTPAVRVEDVAGRTRAANAFSIGIGPTERVVLWNTLFGRTFDAAEVRFVIGHELAHLARDHIARGVAWFALLVLPILAVTALVADVRRPAAVPLALLVIALAHLAVLPLENAISRRYEAEADWIGLNGTRDPAAARGLFTGFVATSLQDPSPPGWVHVLLDDHPTPLQRVEMARAWRARAR